MRYGRLRKNDEKYYDAHCSVFTPSSFELLVRDAAYLGMVPFEVIKIFDAGCEFHAHLRANQATEALRPADYEQTRSGLLVRIRDEAAETSTKYQEMRLALESLAAGGRLTDQPMAQSEVNGRVRQLGDTIRELRASTSWRITEPLRRLVLIFRRT
jgi:hypothetical protein